MQQSTFYLVSSLSSRSSSGMFLILLYEASPWIQWHVTCTIKMTHQHYKYFTHQRNCIIFVSCSQTGWDNLPTNNNCHYLLCPKCKRTYFEECLEVFLSSQWGSKQYKTPLTLIVWTKKRKYNLYSKKEIHNGLECHEGEKMGLCTVPWS